MGISLSRLRSFCEGWLPLQEEIKPAALIRISSGNGRVVVRSFSLTARDDDTEKPADESGETMKLELSVSFKMNGVTAEKETTTISFVPEFHDDVAVATQSPEASLRSSSGKMRLRRSFGSRRRRSGSSSVVLVGQHWWDLLESAELERSSAASTNSAESAKSKWCRAKVKAVRVGKGLSKNAVFRQLASQHWLEAVDPGHRYGHNLRYYHVLWCKSPSTEPFFHWLNHGEGKELNLDESCPRLKLHQQRVKYLSPAEREAYEVLLADGMFRYKKTNKLIDTSGDGKWIFVLSTSRTLYVGKKRKGLFHHSSFLAGGAISAAGGVTVENGILKAISRQSGHYRPTEENFNYFVSFLKENKVDFTHVDMACMDEGEANLKRSLRRNLSEEDLNNIVGLNQEIKTLKRPASKTFRIRSKTFCICSLRRRLSFVLIPEKHHPFRSLSAPLCR